MAQFNVSKSIPNEDEFTPANASEVVTNRKGHIMRDSPFLSYLLQSATVVETEQIPTMAMTQMGHLLYNPRFVDALSKSEVSGVLVHEILHLALRSFPRQRGRNMDEWNIATDLHINYFVQYNTSNSISVPENLDMRELIPEDSELADKIPEEADTITEFYIPNEDGTYKLEVGEQTLHIDINEQDAEEIYDIYKEAKEEEQEKNGDDGQDGDEGDITDQLSDGSGVEDGTFDNIYSEDDIVISDSDEDGKKTIQLPDGAEVEVPEDSIDQDKDWDEITASAQQHANQRGEMPAGMEDRIQSSNKNRIDWKKYIHQVIKQNVPSGYTWSRPSAVTLGNKNVGYMPGRDKSDKLSVIVVVDTSGSVSDELLSTFLGEVSGIVRQNKQCDMVLIQHDADVQKVEEFSRPKESDFEQVEIKGRGGTKHEPVFEYIAENHMSGSSRSDPTVVINLTDGYTSTPEAKNWPKFDQCLWVIPNHDVGMDRLTKGEIIRVEPDEY